QVRSQGTAAENWQSRADTNAPRVAVEGFGGRNFYRGGAGSDVAAFGIDDNSWGIGVGATLPIFSGGALRADLNRSRLSLRQLQRQRAAVEQDVETRVRISMEAAASSFSAIELTADAARAATENLDLITDSYSKGAKSVTDLIDAQNAALAAELSAAEAKYIYLNDVITVLREANDFSLLLDAQYANDWFAEVQAYFQSRGVQLN
nr:TolC family protein [Gammaproteobacteria bacterium]